MNKQINKDELENIITGTIVLGVILLTIYALPILVDDEVLAHWYALDLYTDHHHDPFTGCDQAVGISQTECEALVALYEATDGPNWSYQTGWLENNSPCHWSGVSCSSGTVQQLSLGWRGLSGDIPPAIGDLSNLQMIYMRENQISSLPPEFGNLTNLQTLNLSWNQIASLPPEFGSLTNLETLYLDNNPLSGVLPEFLTGLTQLQFFAFHTTGWCAPATGPVADWLNDIPEVWGTAVTCFTGCADVTEIPQTDCEALVALYNATNGTNWHNQENWLFANAPCSWHGVSCSGGFVSQIYLSSNGLSGDVPSEIGNLNNILSIGLSQNHLMSLPATIGNLATLEGIYLNNNHLTTLPPEIGNLTNLSYLDLHNNQLTALPTQIGDLTSLQTLALSNNLLMELPEQIGNLNSLQALALSSNLLIELPAQIGSLHNLQQLMLTNNQLTAVPSEISGLGNLTHLYLNNNQLTTLPPEIGSLDNLSYLSAVNNQIVELPLEIGDLGLLQSFHIHNNSLDGPIPNFLTTLNLSYFTFYNTNWCVPDDSSVQDWLASIFVLDGTGYVCNQPAASLHGVVTDHEGQALSSVQASLYLAPIWGRFLVGSSLTNELGEYQFDNLGEGINYYLHFQDVEGQLAPQYYDEKPAFWSADPVTMTLGTTRTINAQLNLIHPPLLGVGIGSSGVTTTTNPLNGHVSILIPPGAATPLTISYSASCSSGEVPLSVVLHYNNNTYPMSFANGQYHTVIPAADLVASSPIVITTSCSDGDSDTPVGGVVLYDPSGIVTNALTGQPVVGGKVTLYQVPGWQPRVSPEDMRPNTCESHHSKEAGAPWSQPAPTELGVVVNVDFTVVDPLVSAQYTNEVGYYGWDVPQGCWYVVVEARGYHPLTSPVVGVPPEVLDLDLALMPSEIIYLPLIVGLD